MLTALRTIWSTIATVWSLAVAILRFRRQIRKQGGEVLSVTAGVRYRRWLEREVLEFIDKREDSRIERLFGGLLDAAGLRQAAVECATAVLKSHNLDIVLNSTTTLGRQQARAAIIEGAKDPEDRLTDWQGPAADRARP